jgi:hypothetical protein
LLVMLLVAPAFAQMGVTLFGPSGGAVLPTADIMEQGRVEAALDFFDTDGDSTLPLRALWGLKPNLEVGGMFSFNDASDVWGLNAKLGTRFIATDAGGTAVGAQFMDVRDLDGEAWQVYGVHTHSFGSVGGPGQLRGSIGVNWTQIDFFDFDDSALRIFGIVDYMLANGWTFGVEMQSGDGDVGDDGPLSSIWARYHLNDRVMLQGGFSNAAPGGLVSGDDHNIFFGASYAFGGGAGDNRQLGKTE